MFRLSLLLLTSLVFQPACGGSAAPPAAGPAASLSEMDAIAEQLAAALDAADLRRVALLPLATTAAGSRTAGGARAAPLSQALSDRLLTALAGRGLLLIERARLAQVIDEQALGQTGLIGSDAINVGQLAGAEAMVLGDVTVLAEVVDIHARVVDVTSGRVLGLAGTEIPRATLSHLIPADHKSAAAPPLTLSTIFLAEHRVGDRWQEKIVRQGATLNSGDGLKIVFETNREAYVYALLIDSSGKGSVIFPQEAIAASNRIRGGRQIEIPPGRDWFFLDHNTGVETIYVLASLAPLPNIAELVERLETMGIGRSEAEADKQITHFVGGTHPTDVVKRGIGGIQQGHTKRVQMSDGGIVEQAADMMTGAGAVVRAVTFVHQ